MKRNLLKPRGIYTPSPLGMVGSYLILFVWTVVVLFPLYWMVITSFKLPVQVTRVRFISPLLIFNRRSMRGNIFWSVIWRMTRRNFINTFVVATISTALSMALGSAAAYGLTRFQYRPKVGMILSFIGCVGVAVALTLVGLQVFLSILFAISLFIILLLTIGKRFKRSLGNNDIGFWLISQRILPPVAVVIPIYIIFQQLGMLDTWQALIITYVAANLPIVVWLMRDYFSTIPLELEECAAIDGASRYGPFLSIVLPLAVPGFVATFLFVLVFAWNEYLFALFLTNANAQTLPVSIAAQNATRGPQWWYMSVLVLIMILPVIFMAILLERYMAKGLLVGAVKG